MHLLRIPLLAFHAGWRTVCHAMAGRLRWPEDNLFQCLRQPRRRPAPLACHLMSAGGSGTLVCEATATDHTLSPTDQHLVLGTAAFWQLVGPADAALRAHFHEKVRGVHGMGVAMQVPQI